MFSRFCLAAPLVVAPSVALAGEPSKGTVITIASVGAWIMFSSIGIVLRSRRNDSSKPSTAAKPDEKA